MNAFIENHIVMFVHILRNAGFNSGISEMMDTLKALNSIDITDKEVFRLSLKALLVKSRQDENIFDNAFNSYFVSDKERTAKMAQFFAAQQEVQILGDDLEFMGEPMEVSDEDMEAYVSMDEGNRQKVRDFLDKASNGVNVTADLKPVVQQQLHSILQRQRDTLGGFTPMPYNTTGQAQMDSILYDMALNKGEEELLLKNIADIKEDEMADAVVLIRRLARILASGIGRRYRRVSSHKTVDVRRSMRCALRYGGVLMDLKYKTHRIQKPDVIVLTDVSGSMLKYSTFLLELMYGLSSVLPGIRCYVFAEKLKKLDLRTFKPDEFVRDESLGDGTDLYHSLGTWLNECNHLLNKKTVLIVLSDTKTIEYRKAATEISGISQRIRNILWLNPLETSEWSRYTQVSAFMPFVTMMEASSVHRLTEALKNL